MTSLTAPIGVFDSGVGGLTVLKHLCQTFPAQSWIYLGDTARLPYGTKSGITIHAYTEENLTFLSQFNCQAFIIACNSASTQFPSDFHSGRPVFKVIKPGAIQALQETRNGKIGIIGTKATISSRVYENELHRLGFSGETFSQACPLFVPLVEEGLLHDAATDLIIDRYLRPMKEAGIDTLILGCTHYPLLYQALNRYFGPSVKLVSSEFQLSQSLAHSHCVQTEPHTPGHITLYTTDRVEFVKDIAERILLGITQTIEYRNISGPPLYEGSL
ncbi:MAG: glutamate racemase [Bdellovibrionaceae bacterium]|nr:glutamate racemase [Pseudobdellovibrionaceae bacterium]